MQVTLIFFDYSGFFVDICIGLDNLESFFIQQLCDGRGPGEKLLSTCFLSLEVLLVGETRFFRRIKARIFPSGLARGPLGSASPKERWVDYVRPFRHPFQKIMKLSNHGTMYLEFEAFRLEPGQNSFNVAIEYFFFSSYCRIM